MKILIIGNCNSAHIKRWVSGLSSHVDLGLWSLSKPNSDFYDKLDVKIFSHDLDQSKTSLSKKVLYLTALGNLKKAIKHFQPDLLHAHYATSYGLLAGLSNFRPFMISIWGSDVFDFPKRSLLHRLLLTYNLKKADWITSTSQVMREEALLYINKEITVIPFGIDLNLFHKEPTHNSVFTFGTVKALEPVYGIDRLIEAFAKVKKKHPSRSMKLLLVGGGSLKDKLIKLSKDLGVSEDVEFVGQVPIEKVPRYQSMLDVAVFLSKSESFGVSALEAGAMGKPVIATDVGGFPEIIKHEKTGLIVLPGNVEAASAAMEKLLLNRELREHLGNAATERVKGLYNWNDNVKQMISIYDQMISN